MKKDLSKERAVAAYFYDTQTGLFSGRRFIGPLKALDGNTPDGMASIFGKYDHLSQRVDLETGEVIDYQPPAPDADHEWNAELRRWKLKPEVRARRHRYREALARIKELESRQLRPARELAIDPGNADARQRLSDIEAEITEIRLCLT